MLLALFTFFATNLFARKHYWKEIFWPDVPMWLKFPIPIMQVIEIFGVFTKPASLTVRLFANMMGGHMIVIVLTLIIFILADLGSAALGATTVVSLLFSIFMLMLDVLVVAKNVNRANTMVTAMLPVRLAPPGNITISPNRFITKMNMNTVSKNGANRRASCPSVGFIIPRYIKSMSDRCR